MIVCAEGSEVEYLYYRGGQSNMIEYGSVGRGNATHFDFNPDGSFASVRNPGNMN